MKYEHIRNQVSITDISRINKKIEREILDNVLKEILLRS